MKRYRVMVSVGGGPHECVLETKDKDEAKYCMIDYERNLRAAKYAFRFDVYIDDYEEDEAPIAEENDDDENE